MQIQRPFWERVWLKLRTLWLSLYWKFTGALLEQELADPESQLRTEAHKAIDRVVYETDIPPDCVKAFIFRGTPSIQITHDPYNRATATLINGESYEHAANRAVEWINRQAGLTFHKTATALPRHERRAFNSHRRRERRKH